MRKQIFSLGLMLAATFTLTNCVKENIQEPQSEGTPFEIQVSAPEVKTVNDGMKTSWVANDEINLFHAVTESSTYVNDGSFVISEAGLAKGSFLGTLNGELDPEEEYDWFAIYPYSSYIKTPANTSSGFLTVGSDASGSQTQEGNNSMAHIAGKNYPIAGYANAVPAGSTPEISMAHVSSLVEVVVTNTVDEPLTVSDIIFNAPEDVVGTYYINFAGDITSASFTSSGASYVSSSATLNVTNGSAIAKGESAKFYLAVKPFTAASGNELSLRVNGYEKKMTLASDVTFKAGKIKTLNFGYDKVISSSSKTVKFNFTVAAELTSMGVALPDAGAGTNIAPLTISKDGVSLTSTNGSTESRVWNSSGSYDLRLYKGATLTLTAPTGCVISNVVLTGADFAKISIPQLPTNPVVLRVASDAGTQKVSSITVEYKEGEIVAYPLELSNAKCTAATANSLTFEWDVNSDAIGYKVSLDGGNTYGETFKENKYVWIGLSPETTYTLNVKAVGNGINSSDSESVAVSGKTVNEQTSVIVYTFATSKSTTNTAYASVFDVTIDGTKWSVPGNQSFAGYVRIGGKSLSNTVRTIYSKGIISDNVSKVVMTTNGVSNANLKVNSITLKVYATAADAASTTATPISTVQNTDASWPSGSSKVITFNRPSGADWTGRYYRVEFNLTNSKTSNYGVDLEKMEFYN